jgi:hypothetical protein
MAIVFASKTDIQSWLRQDKILVDDANSGKPNIDATRIVKGQLAGLFEPIVIASWDGPDNTPELIRGVTGRLTAAFMHASIYSEESDREISAYSQWLYDGAMFILAQILAGTMTVVDVDENPVDTTGAGLLSFFPDDSVLPVFTMDKEFN